MEKAALSLVVVLALGLDLALAGDAVVGAGAAANPEAQMLAEEKNFAEYLVYAYNPELWVSRGNRLYFAPRNGAQRAKVEAMEAGRRRYAAFTNREARYQFVAKVLAESGLDVEWQKKLLLPYAATNLYLTPVLDQPGQVVDRYSVLKSLPNGDTLIQAGDSICGVVGFGRGASDVYQTNALLVKEGWMTYRTESNEVRWVEAFSDVALTAAETAVLDRAAAAFQRRAALLTQALAALQKKPAAPGQPTPKAQAKLEFEDLKARAAETSPFTEYRLARAYLEGNGTDKDEKLGLLWMNKAAHDGSGDASTYLQGLSSSKGK
jgi:hypothetical protein